MNQEAPHRNKIAARLAEVEEIKQVGEANAQVANVIILYEIKYKCGAISLRY